MLKKNLRKTSLPLSFIVCILCMVTAVFGFQKSILILPIGDSITRGGGYPIGAIDYPTYRYYLLNKLKDVGWDIDYVGPYNGVGIDFDFSLLNPNPYMVPVDYQKTGHPTFPDQDMAGSTGWTINKFLGDPLEANTLVEDYDPDMILVHLGTNDIGSRQDTPSDAVSEVGQLIDLLRTGNPAVKIYLAQVIPLLDGAYGLGDGEYGLIIQYNSLLPDLISQKNNQPDFNEVTLVDMWTDFDPQNLLAEATHPNNLGDEEIANRWFNAIIPEFLNLFKAEFSRSDCVVGCFSDFDQDGDVDGADLAGLASRL